MAEVVLRAEEFGDLLKSWLSDLTITEASQQKKGVQCLNLKPGFSNLYLALAYVEFLSSLDKNCIIGKGGGLDRGSQI